MSAPNSEGRLNLSGGTLAAVVLMVTLAVGSILTLIILERPLENMLSLLTIILVPSITAIINGSKLREVQAQLSEVDSKVNGRMSQLIDSKTTAKEGEHSAD